MLFEKGGVTPVDCLLARSILATCRTCATIRSLRSLGARTQRAPGRRM